MIKEKYRQLLDEEIIAFIARSETFYPPDAVALSIADQRVVYNRMCRAFHADYPSGVTAQDSVVQAAEHSIPVRTYRLTDAPPAAHIIYYHGGGFVVGGLDSHDDVCAEFCARTGYRVTSVDYRLAPEHTHPSAFNDALRAYEFLSETGGDLPIILAGDSAGATLAATVAHATRQHAIKPVRQVLIYPALGGDMNRGSALEHANAPLLSRDDMIFYENIVAADKVVKDDPTFMPLADTDFSGLPATVIFSAACDPLAEDGRDYQRRMTAVGGQAQFFDEAGLVHGYLRARHSSAVAKASFERIITALSLS